MLWADVSVICLRFSHGSLQQRAVFWWPFAFQILPTRFKNIRISRLHWAFKTLFGMKYPIGTIRIFFIRIFIRISFYPDSYGIDIRFTWIGCKSPTKPWRSGISVLLFFKLNPRVLLESLCSKWITLTTAKEKTFPVTCHRQISMNRSFFFLGKWETPWWSELKSDLHA